MNKIEKIIEKSALDIKKILLDEAQKRFPFPAARFGFYDADYADKTPNVIVTMLGQVDHTSYGIAKPREGILVHDEGRFWTENEKIYLLPCGLYRFKETTFVSEIEENQQLLDTFPSWKSKEERLSDYHAYGVAAWGKLQELK